MKEIKDCSVYTVKNFSSETEQVIYFVEKMKDGEFNDGTTNEEIISMLIERFYSLQKRSFSVENQIAISLLKDVRRHLNKRLARKVENKRKYDEDIES